MRLLPQGLAGRFALLLTAALVAANLVAFALLAKERDRMGREARAEREIERIVALVPALEEVAPPRRRGIARRASTPLARIRVEPRAAVGTQGGDRASRRLAARLSEALAPRAVRVGWPVTRRPGAGGAGPRPLAFSVALDAAAPGGRPLWLNVVTRGGYRGPDGAGGEALFLVLVTSLVAVLGVGLVFVRRLTRPLGALAAAARAAGRGDRTARVPETGAREMREAAAAFNAMQGRIARFEAERMRTLAAVGHDLRTPLTSLRIRTEMLDEAQRDPMVRTLDEMTVMADGLVAYARGDAEVEETGPVDLAALLTHLCGERGAALDVAEGATVAGRPVALGRAVGNLIDNAIRYGGAARVRLSREGEAATVSVEDDGPGIAPERLDAMMEPFVRGEASRSAETGGAGLGLSIARQIARAHGGTLTLQNRPGGGLRAALRLPLAGMGNGPPNPDSIAPHTETR